MRDTAVANQEEVKDYYKQRHDAKARDRYYPNGTKVLVFSTVVTGKRVEKLMTDGTVRIPSWEKLHL